MTDDSTQSTSSKSPSYQNTSAETVVSIRRNWDAQTFSLSCGEQSSRCSFTPDISHVLTPAGLHVVRHEKNEVTGTGSARDGGQSIGCQNGNEGFESGESIYTPLRRYA